MSELKATTAQEIVQNEKDCDYMDELFGGVKMPPTQVYLKSEADKVIAVLKNEIEVQKRLRNMALASVPNALKVMKIIQHQKYKWCLAMAEMCNARYDAEDAKVNGCGASWDYIRKEMKYWERWGKRKYWERWGKRWLKLAEKFKPNNSTAQ